MTFTSWLRGLAHGTKRTQRSSRRAACRSRRSSLRLVVETLEDRALLAGVDFSAAQTFPSGGTGVYSVASADFNNDGHADLAVTNLDSNSVGVLLGNGSGGFASPVAYNTGGSGSYSIAVADFNGDGRADLGVTNLFANTVGVLMGNGDGSFASPVAFNSGGQGPYSIAVGDFNGDGKTDVVVGNHSTANVGVLLGDGNGSFAPAVSFATGGALGVAVADFNNDGKADLAVTNANNSTVGVLLGNGTGGFAPAVTFATGGSYSWAVAAGDFNNDGKPDLTVTNYNSNNVGVLLGDGLGGFASAATFAASVPISVAVGDFNNDGQADLAVVNQSVGVGVLLGNGLGGFAPVVTFASGGSNCRSVAAGDFNGDGKTDLAVANSSNSTVGVLLNTTVTNQPPVNTVPGDQVGAEDVAKVIVGLSVADDNAAGILTVTLAVGHGTLIVNWGVALANGTVLIDNGTSTVSLTGTQAQINATLAAGLAYRGGLNYSGLDALTMTTADAGGLTDTDVVAIEVVSAQQQAELLMAIMSDLGDDGVLTGGQENALVKKLSFLSGPNGAQAVQAFINQVNGMLNAGILTQLQADDLIASAQSILASIQ